MNASYLKGGGGRRWEEEGVWKGWEEEGET